MTSDISIESDISYSQYISFKNDSYYEKQRKKISKYINDDLEMSFNDSKEEANQ